MSLGSVSTDHLGHPSISLEGWSLPLSEIVNTKCSWDETELTHAGLALGQRKASSRPARLPTSSGPGRPAAGRREHQGSAGRVRRCWGEPALKAALGRLPHTPFSCPATQAVQRGCRSRWSGSGGGRPLPAWLGGELTRPWRPGVLGQDLVTGVVTVLAPTPGPAYPPGRGPRELQARRRFPGGGTRRTVAGRRPRPGGRWEGSAPTGGRVTPAGAHR